MDNIVMIQAGDLIDNTIGVQFGLATLTAAAYGQVVSDTSGVVFGGAVEAFFTRLGLPVPTLSIAQKQLKISKYVATGGAACGVILGCLLGMVSLLFLDLEAADRRKREKELETIFHTVMAEGHRLVHAERCALFLVDHENGEIWSKVASGLKESDRITAKIGEGIAGKVAATGQRIVSADAYKDSRFTRRDSGFRKSDQESGFQTRSVLCCPVKNSNGKVVAVVQFLNKKDGPAAGSSFDETDIKLTELLCSHVAIFIDTVERGGDDD